MLFEIELRELFFIAILRHFKFLEDLGFIITEVFINPKEIGLKFANKTNNRSLYICLDETNRFYFEIERSYFGLLKERNIKRFFCKKDLEFFFNLKDTDEVINEGNIIKVIKTYSHFLEDNFINLLKGKEWITDILKKKREIQKLTNKDEFLIGN